MDKVQGLDQFHLRGFYPPNLRWRDVLTFSLGLHFLKPDLDSIERRFSKNKKKTIERRKV